MHHNRIPRHLLLGNWSDALTTTRQRVKDIQNKIVTMGYNKFITGESVMDSGVPSGVIGEVNREVSSGGSSGVNRDFGVYHTLIPSPVVSQSQPVGSPLHISTVSPQQLTTVAPINMTLGTTSQGGTQVENIISAFTINTGNLLHQSHHNIMVAVLLGIFLCITLTITIGILVFCRKKNSVFMLQKCEQDSDLEMTDMNTEVETSDSEYEFIESSSVLDNTRQSVRTPDRARRSVTCPELHLYNSPVNLIEECSEHNLYNSQVNIAEEHHTRQDKHSKHRTGHHSNRHQQSESPTSTPLLNSHNNLIIQTGAHSSSVGTNLQGKKLRHSQTFHCVSEHTYSGARLKSKKSQRNKQGNSDYSGTAGLNQDKITILNSNSAVRPKQTAKRKTGTVKKETDRKCETRNTGIIHRERGRKCETHVQINKCEKQNLQFSEPITALTAGRSIRHDDWTLHTDTTSEMTRDITGSYRESSISKNTASGISPYTKSSISFNTESSTSFNTESSILHTESSILHMVSVDDDDEIDDLTEQSALLDDENSSNITDVENG